jgi:peroxiredoxin
VLQNGDLVPDVSVWSAPNARVSLRELAGGGSILLVFYLFDWSST